MTEKFTDPGLPRHRPRMGDTDPTARKRALRQVIALFTISIIGTIAMLVLYFVVPPDGTIAGIRRSNLLLGAGLFLALAGIGFGAIHWAKAIMANKEIAEERHPMASSESDVEAATVALQQGAAESGIARRPLLKGAMLGALALFPLSILVPLLGNVGGDWNVSQFKHTVWRKGTRLTRDPEGTPIKAADVTIGSVFHVIPEHLKDSEDYLEEKSKALVLLIRMDPRDFTPVAGREDWSFDGIVAYSKICTHVGCPVALYEQQTHHLLCPCHQSTFDVAHGAKVVFGPAKRPLPQLPIAVDGQGYLIATSDFHEPVGPSFWERDK